jgi:hypothetical protein
MRLFKNRRQYIKFFILNLFNKIKIVDDLRFRIGVVSILANRVNYSKLKWLWDAEVKVFSQWGEDGILDYLCEKLELVKPCILELGAGNFTECNSRFTSEFRNADAFLVDGRMDLIKNIKLSSLYWRNTIKAKREWITTDNILEIYREAEDFMSGVDILSLDFDGNDFWLMENIPLDRISIVVVEYNPLLGYRHPVSIPLDNKFERGKSHYSHLYYGASILAWILHFKAQGFGLVGTNRAGNNAFFVKDILYDKVKTLKEITVEDLPRWRVREARDMHGNLSYSLLSEQIEKISHLEVANTISGEIMTVGQLHNEF